MPLNRTILQTWNVLVRRPLVTALDALHPRMIDLALAEDDATSWRADAPGSYCGRCGATIGPHGGSSLGCPFCINHSLPWEQMVRLGAYRPPQSRWVLALKYHHQWRWGQWLGAQLAQAIPPSSDDAMTALCPVPMHWRRRWSRHYNHARLIAQGIAAHRAWPTLDLLARTAHRPSQTAIPPHQREANVRRCMKARPFNLTGWHVWLVDDVKTSGSTLTQCARLLKKQGAEQVHVAVVCVADPKATDFKWTQPLP